MYEEGRVTPVSVASPEGRETVDALHHSKREINNLQDKYIVGTIIGCNRSVDSTRWPEIPRHWRERKWQIQHETDCSGYFQTKYSVPQSCSHTYTPWGSPQDPDFGS